MKIKPTVEIVMKLKNLKALFSTDGDTLLQVVQEVLISIGFMITLVIFFVSLYMRANIRFQTTNTEEK